MEKDGLQTVFRGFLCFQKTQQEFSKLCSLQKEILAFFCCYQFEIFNKTPVGTKLEGSCQASKKLMLGTT